MVPKEEIPTFVDTNKWIEYFPSYGIKDLKKFGLATDWRRSFITTNKNQYYDAFIKWQFNTLYKNKYIDFGKRPSIYSIKDAQVCADHDRSTGEGVNPIEYSLIKMKMITLPESFKNI